MHLSAAKIMESVFLYLKGVVHVDFLPCGVTINAQYITLTCFAMIFTK
jgi:hypothetical protein